MACTPSPRSTTVLIQKSERTPFLHVVYQMYALSVNGRLIYIENRIINCHCIHKVQRSVTHISELQKLLGSCQALRGLCLRSLTHLIDK